jgi:hypothetical protein
LARKPNTTEPEAGTEPLYVALRTVTAEPLAVGERPPVFLRFQPRFALCHRRP